MYSRPLFPALVFFALLLGGCGGGTPGEGAAAGSGTAASAPAANAGATWSEMSVAELQARMDGKDFPLINVHIPFEGDLPGTDDSIPFDRITDHLDRLPEDKDATIVLYCRTGRMSIEAAEELAGLGYTSVYNLTGGFLEWTAAGFPMAGG